MGLATSLRKRHPLVLCGGASGLRGGWMCLQNVLFQKHETQLARLSSKKKIFFFCPRDMWDLSSLVRDRTRAPCSRSPEP